MMKLCVIVVIIVLMSAHRIFNKLNSNNHMQLFVSLSMFFVIAIPVMAVIKDKYHKPIKHKYDRYE